MWASRTLLNYINIEAKKKFSCGSGFLLGSILLLNNKQSEDKSKWNVEYPKSKADGITLSRKVKII